MLSRNTSDFTDSQARFASTLREAVVALEGLPASACPNDEAVLSFWLRPARRIRENLMREARRVAPFRTIGSRAPRARPGDSLDLFPEECYVAGRRTDFRRLADKVGAARSIRRRAATLEAVLRIAAPTPKERVRVGWGKGEPKAIEVVLHADNGVADRPIVEGFRAYLGNLGLRPHRDRILVGGGLGFLSLRATEADAHEIARFAFVRVIRDMAGLRPLTGPFQVSPGWLRPKSSQPIGPGSGRKM